MCLSIGIDMSVHFPIFYVLYYIFIYNLNPFPNANCIST